MNTNNRLAERANRVFILQFADTGRHYTESPEEQGRGGGPRLLRLFLDPREAECYRNAIQTYADKPLVCAATTMRQLLHRLERQRGPLQVEICSCAQDEWPRSLDVVWTGPRGLIH